MKQLEVARFILELDDLVGLDPVVHKLQPLVFREGSGELTAVRASEV